MNIFFGDKAKSHTLVKSKGIFLQLLDAIIFLRPFFISYTLPFFVAIFLMFIVAGTTASYAYLVKEVLDKIFVDHNLLMLKVLPLAIIIITLVKNVSLFFQTRLMQVIMAKITLNVQKALYRKYISSDVSFFDNTPTGAMVTRIFHTTNAIAEGLNTILVVAIREFLTVIALFAVLFFQSPTLTLISIVSVPFTIIPVVIISKKLRKSMETAQGGMEQIMSHADDSLKYPRLVKSNVAEEFEIQRSSVLLGHFLSLRKKIISLSSLLPSINETISIIGVACVIWYGGHAVVNDKMTSGEFFAFFTAMTIAYKPLKSLTKLNFTIQMFLMSVTLIRGELESPISIKNKPNTKPLQNCKGAVEFSNVSFKYYKEHEQNTIQDISFTLEAGKTLAIVGPTGAGKSTIISLLERFYEPSSGTIKIDGINIQDITLESLRGSISLVTQDVQLLNDTIENNIKYTKVDATHEQVVHAARLANAEEFILQMPNAYQSRVGQSGVKLSGGQKQRIAIARAILYNAPIVLLDEATSALDSISEKLIQDALDKFKQNKTTIAIAHRLSTIINADKILVMHQGRIVEHGTHSELISHEGHYKNLYTTQFNV